MPFFERDEVSFHYIDVGQGAPFVFQHGLGGDVSQPQELFRPPPGVRLLSFDCRGHGQTRPLGEVQAFRIAHFADDLAALLDHCRLDSAIIGGTSMGAAVALNFALRYADRVTALVLSRPAWLDEPHEANVRRFAQIARLIREHGAREGHELYLRSDDYADLRRLSPDVAESLQRQFLHPRAEETVVKLERIPPDAPNRDRHEWKTIAAATLVIANRQDPIHPFEFGETLAELIPKAEFQELTPKSVSPEQHTADVQRHLERFLRQHIT